ncbi:hypothetical protein HJFPF1_05426 [Paramyrothecium foliicola]|nr:hypothetical protein HJFPF1_05426 [Paramyrothecium foliicola]
MISTRKAMSTDKKMAMEGMASAGNKISKSRAFVPNNNVWVEDTRILADAQETARIFKLISDLPKERGNYELASYKKDTYYVWLRYTSPSTEICRICDRSGKDTVEGFVPLAFLAALGLDEVPWKTNELFMSKPDQVDHDLGGTATLSEAEKNFINDWRSFWFISPQKYQREAKDLANVTCCIPTRDQNGKLNFWSYGPSSEAAKAFRNQSVAVQFKTTWYAILESNWKKRTSTSTGRPPRWARVPLLDGMLIEFHMNHLGDETLDESIDTINTGLARERFLQSKQLEAAENVVTTMDKRREEIDGLLLEVPKRPGLTAGRPNISTILDNEQPRVDREKLQAEKTKLDQEYKVAAAHCAYLKNRASETWEVVRVSSNPSTGNDKWFKLSTCPFNLYSTYITKSDWNKYMGSLAKDVGGEDASVPRPHGPIHWKPAGETENVQKMYSKFITATEKAQEVLRDTSNPQKNLSDATKAVQNCLQGTFSLKDEHKYEQIVQLVADNHFKKFETGVRLSGTLDYPKIKKASSKRDGEHDQGTIMGASANKVAEELGWKHDNGVKRDINRMNNHLYTAEWLHLRAYSWGGHLNEDVYQGFTSQIPLNLVLGTSETNSVMLRYEKAWQNLFIFEHDLNQKLESDEKPSGKIWIRTNPTEAPQDKHLDGGDEAMGRMEAWDNIAKFEYDSWDSQGFTIKECEADSDILELTKKYPWIAHSIAYYVTMDTKSYSLGCDNISKAIKFYPFRRSFYHRVESLLDSFLFNELKKSAIMAAVSTLADLPVSERERKKKKILGKDYVPPRTSGNMSIEEERNKIPIRTKQGETKKKEKTAFNPHPGAARLQDRGSDIEEEKSNFLDPQGYSYQQAHYEKCLDDQKQRERQQVSCHFFVEQKKEYDERQREDAIKRGLMVKAIPVNPVTRQIRTAGLDSNDMIGIMALRKAEQDVSSSKRHTSLISVIQHGQNTFIQNSRDGQISETSSNIKRNFEQLQDPSRIDGE